MPAGAALYIVSVGRAITISSACGHLRYTWTGFTCHSLAIMPKTAIRQSDQSVIGLFRAIGVDARALPRTRPLYRRLVALLESAIARDALAAGYRLPPERDLASAL